MCYHNMFNSVSSEAFLVNLSTLNVFRGVFSVFFVHADHLRFIFNALNIKLSLQVERHKKKMTLKYYLAPCGVIYNEKLPSFVFAAQREHSVLFRNLLVQLHWDMKLW